MKLGYLILAHESYSDLNILLDTLCFYPEDQVILHHDKKSKYHEDITLSVKKYKNLSLVESVIVEWGEVSIVHATLEGIKLALTKDIDYLILLSGSCMPITARSALVKHLELMDGDFIECHDPVKSRWVKDGLEKERWEHFNFFNWRKNPLLFSLSHKIQHKLKIKRRLPSGINFVLGSQWWGLKKDTLKIIMSFINKNNFKEFLYKTWIPDEFFLQSIVYSVKSNDTIHNILMHYRFNNVGVPKVFTLADINEIDSISGKKFFVRKIDKKEHKLKDYLSSLYLEKLCSFPTVEPDTLLQPSIKNLISDIPIHNNIYPIYVFVMDSETDYDFLSLRDYLKTKFNMFFYGELFSTFKIDYGEENYHPLYEMNDVSLRDYDLRAFSFSLFKGMNLISFVVNIDDFDRAHYAIRQFPIIKFVFSASSYKKNLGSISRALALKKYLKSDGYDVIYEWEPEKLKVCLDNDIVNSCLDDIYKQY